MAGINFQDGLPNLLGLRFADDIVLSCRSADKVIEKLKEWCLHMAQRHGHAAFCIGNLTAERWVKRTLRWTPPGARVAGYPRRDWTSKFHAFITYCQTDVWPNLTSNSAVGWV